MPNPKLETYKNKATGDVYDYTDADAQGKLTAILDGTTIESFSDVESALADKVDVESGKGLSTNDYDDTEKTKVAAAFPRSEQAVLGAKNIIPYPYHSPNSYTSHDVGFTVNTNKTVTTDSGTASGDDAVFTLLQKSDTAFNDFFELTKGKTIKLTGVPEGASTSTYWLMIYDTSAHNLVSGEMEYQMPETMPSAFYLQIVVKNGQSASNKIWKPMISFDGGEYVPPAMTNKQLTDELQEPELSGVDVNTLVEPKRYHLVSNITNLPSGVTTGVLDVIKITSTGVPKKQILWPSGNPTKFYIRDMYSNGTWSAWCEFTGTVLS